MTHNFCSSFIRNTVKQGRSPTQWLVRTKFNMSSQRGVSAERLLKGRKHFSQSVRPMVSVAVSKLGKTDLVFVQPGAKTNSVYYCENVLELAICRISNNDFVFKQDAAPCTTFITMSLTCIPMCLSSLNLKPGRRTVHI